MEAKWREALELVMKVQVGSYFYFLLEFSSPNVEL